MGLIYTALTLNNPAKPALKAIGASALVDTGALHLCIPPHIAIQLELEELEQREVTVADGGKKLCPYVGPVGIQFQNRHCFTGALVIGDAVLLGAIPMEDMDLVVQPALLQVTTNPASPNVPTSTVK